MTHAGTMYSSKLVDHLLWFETTLRVFTPAALNLKQFKLHQVSRMLFHHGALGAWEEHVNAMQGGVCRRKEEDEETIANTAVAWCSSSWSAFATSTQCSEE